MQVNYSETIRKSVHITDDEANRIVLQRLYHLFDWGDEYFIKNNQVWTTNEYLTSHRFEMDEVVRDATDQDIFAQEMIKQIKIKMRRD